MDIYKRRQIVILLIIAAVFCIYLGKLFSIQIVSQKYKDLATRNVIRKVTVHPNRGLIYDRNGKLIVVNDAVYEIMVIPRQVKEMDTLLFCKLLNIDTSYFKKRLGELNKGLERYKSNTFVKQVPLEQYAVFQEYLHNFPGFYGEVRLIRKYPYASGAHILGDIGEVGPDIVKSSDYYKAGDYIGVSGLEYTYENQLRGVRGNKFVTVDKFNRIQGPYAEGMFDTAAISGSDLTISIDIDLQRYGEELMKNKLGSIVAIEPSTGQILCMVSSPGYDPNLLRGRHRGENYAALVADTLKPLFNRPIMAGYPPGSTFKPIQALIGLQEGVLKPSNKYPCLPGYRMGSLLVGCHGHGPIKDLSSAIEHSCNAYFCYVFRNIIDQERYGTAETALKHWDDYLYSFGMGHKLGIDIPNEKPGLVPTPDLYNKMYPPGSWKSSTIISLSIGQGELGITPLQQANMYCAIANRGFYYTPHFVEGISGDTTDLLAPYRVKHQTLVDPSHFEPVIQGLYQTCEEGTGMSARIKGVEVCGKTGTVENPHGVDHSAFVAFAPKDNPKIVVSVFVENSGWGSSYAAPIAGLIIEKYLNDTIATAKKPLEKRMLDADLITNPPTHN